MELLQIILFASLALFFAIRLYSILGRRTGHEPKPEERARGAAQEAAADEESDRPRLRPAFTGPAAAGMEAIRAADGVFDPDTFTKGAVTAYKMIVTGFAEGDRGVLQPLLASDVMRRYGDALDAREAAGRTQIVRIGGVREAEIENAWLVDGLARVEIRIKADIATAVKDAEEEVVEGDPNNMRTVTEYWTFERRVDSSDPNWMLAKVRQD